MAGIKFDFTGDNRNLLNSAKQAQQGVTNAINGIERAGRGIESTFSKIKSGILGGFTDIAKGMAGLTALIQGGSFIKELIDDANRFNVAMKEVSTLSEDVARNLQQYKDQVVDMTTQIPIEATEASKALYQIESAGHHGADGLNVLRESAKGAIGGVTDTATTADAITTILNAYKMEASEAQHVSDLLFTTVRLGKTNMSQLGTTIAQVAPVAASFGVSIEDVLAAIASLTKQGTKTSVAVRQVRDAITATTKSMGDSAFQGRSFLDAMDEVAEKAQGSNNALRQDLGTLQALNAVLSLTGKNSQAARQDVADMQNSAGAAEAAYEKMASTAGTQTTLLRNNIFKAILPLAEEMKSMSGEIAKSLNEAFDSGAMDKAIVSLEAFIAAYATYRGLLAATTAWNSAAIGGTYQLQIAELQQLIPLKELDGQADLQAAVAKGELSIEQAKLVASLRAETEARYEEIMAAETEARANLKALVAAEAGAQANVIAADEMVAAAQARVAAALESGSASEIEAALEELNTAERLKNSAATELNTIQRQKNGAATMVGITSKNADTAATLMNTTQQEANTFSTGILATAKLKLKMAIDAVNASFLASPLFWIGATIAAVAYGVYSLVTAETAHEAAVRETNEALEAQKNQLKERRDTIDKLIQTIQNQNSTEFQRVEAYDELKKIAPDIADAYSKEALETMKAADAQKMMNKAMDEAKFQNASKAVEEWEEKVKVMEQLYEHYLKMSQEGVDVSMAPDYVSLSQLEKAKEQLKIYRERLKEITRLREEAEKDKIDSEKPIQLKVKEAEENKAEKQRILDFFDKVMVRVKDIQSAHNNLNFDEAQNKLGAYISEIQSDLADLHKRVEQNPLDQKLKLQEKEKTNLLNELLKWQSNMHAEGYTTIPLFFRLEWSSAKEALDKAVNIYKRWIGKTTKGGSKSMAELLTETKGAYDKAVTEWKRVTNPKNQAFVTPEEYNRAKSGLATAKEAYEAAGGDPDGKRNKGTRQGSKNLANQQEQERKQREKYQQMLKKQELERRREIEDMIFDTRQAEIDALKDSTEKSLKQMDLDFNKRKIEIERGYEDLKQTKIDAARALWEANPDNKNKPFDESTVDTTYTKEEEQNYKSQLDANRAEYDRSVEERIRAEEKANREAVNSYLMQWGDYEQKKQAIYDSANAEICEAEEQMSEALTEEAKSAAEARINTVRKETKQKVDELDKQYGKAKQFMIDLFGDASKKSVAELDKIIKKYETLVKFLEGNGEASREDLISVGFTDDEIDKAMERLNAGEITVKEFADRLKELVVELSQRSPWLTFSKTVGDALENFRKGETGKGIQNIGKAVSDFLPELKEFASGLSSIFGFDDTQTQGVIDAVGGIGTAAAGIGQMYSGDIIGGAMTAVQGIGQITDALEGLFGADYAEYEALVKEYENLTDVWDTLIDRKKEYISLSYGVEAVKAGKEALELIEKEAEAYRILGKERLNSGASAGSHSIGVRIKNNTSADDWRSIAAALGMSVQQAQELMGGRLTGLFDLTTEQIKALQENNQVWWAKLDDDVRKYLESIIDNEEKWKDMQSQIREQLTTTTETDVFDSFLEKLYDLADGVEDVTGDITKDWQRMVNRMVINNLIATEFQGKLKQWYEELAKLQDERNGGMTDEEYKRRLEALLNQYNGLFDDAQDRVEQFTELGIIKPVEEAADKTTELIEGMTDSIRSAFQELISDTTTDIAEWTEELRNTIIRSFIENLLLGDEFDEWAKQWSERYTQLTQSLTGGQIGPGEYNARLKALIEELDAMSGSLSERARELMEALGFSDTGEQDGAFSGLRDTFRDMLTDMADDAKEFRRKLEETLVRDLIEKQVLDVPITVNGMTFDDFNAYVEDWNRRYAEAVRSGNQEAIDALIDELMQVRELTLEQAEELRERLREETDDTTFKDMADSFRSTLMDMSKDADDWSQELGKNIAQKIIDGMLAASMLQPLLDRLQEAFNAAMAEEGATTQSVINAITPQLEAIRAAYPELQELVKGIMDGLGLDTLTTQGFSDLRSTFVSALTGMKTDAADFGKDIARTLIEQMIDQLVRSRYQEQMDALNEAWREALEAGDSGMIEDIRQQIIDLYEAIGNDEAINKLREDLERLGDSTTPFDGMRDSFRNELMDMSKDAKDFKNDIMQSIAESFVEQFVLGDEFEEMLAQWKDRYKEIMGDSDLTEEQRLKQLKELGELIASERDGLSQQTQDILTLLGLNNREDQTATVNMADKATYDQFELYLGIAMGQEMLLGEQKQIQQEILSTLQSMAAVTQPGTSYGEQIFHRLGTTNDYLLATKRLVGEISDKIDTLNSHLSRL